ncbi:MAG: 3'(2'),5'-bisphosphate nucleotidase CysQ [Actinomycetota bacterium]|jgi:3'(2'), 5'-bisphosphate nucleotidase|nr:3'(2'),5'-bisphosphate nucleotidase CysQ [Actinomycetota bacterium]
MIDVEHRAAAGIAEAAGRLLLQLRARPELADKALRDEGDRRSNDRILSLLAEAFPDDAVLSEESSDSTHRLDRQRVWIVDPLDGTREFGEPGRSDWAVHVALAVDGQPVVGAVALPGLDLVLSTQNPPRLPARGNDKPRLVVSRTRPPDVTDQVAAALDAELLPMGSAGAKAMAVVRGEADVYCHAGGQYEWDSAAPVAVAAAAGLHVSRLDGSALRYNRPDPWLPDLLICRNELADAVIAAAAG